MTIREMEARCGMDRANIRFYEREGLLTAPRLQNGYRDYTEENAQTLLRIRLLRSLHVPLDEIRALQTGEKALPETLRDQLARLAREEADAAAAGRVCREIEAEHVSFSELDAPKYLRRLESGAPARPAPQLEEDRTPYPRCPVRRYFARWLDGCLYTVLSLWLLSLCGVLFTQTQGLSLLLELMTLALTVFLEPALLHWFGTTPGKALLGLSVETEDGTHLSYGEGWCRVWGVLWRGCGLHIPVYALVRQYQCLDAALAGERMPWDEGYVYVQRDRRAWRIPAFAAAVAGSLFLTAAVCCAQQLAPNRGALTAAQYAENYNYYSRYFTGQPVYALRGDGSWAFAPDGGEWTVTEERADGSWVATNADGSVYSGISAPPQPMHIETEDGAVRRVWFEYSPDPDAFCPDSGLNSCILTALSLVGAQKQAGIFSNAPAALEKCISEGLKNGALDTELCGVHLTAVCESNGYYPLDSRLVSMEDVPDGSRYYRLTFTAAF